VDNTSCRPERPTKEAGSLNGRFPDYGDLVAGQGSPSRFDHMKLREPGRKQHHPTHTVGRDQRPQRLHLFLAWPRGEGGERLMRDEEPETQGIALGVQSGETTVASCGSFF
jgi:hypothetical protein